MFKKEINSIKLSVEAEVNSPSVINYTHCKFTYGGVILYSNKNKAFKIPPMFVKYQDIVVLTFKP